MLADRGVKPGERVCLFLDRVPDLYIAFLGILKLGAIVQPLFSAFGEDSLETRLGDAETVRRSPSTSMCASCGGSARSCRRCST